MKERWPRGLSRFAAAQYVGVSANTFDKMIKLKNMPGPKQASENRKIWDRQQLDAAIEVLPEVKEENEWREWREELKQA